MADASNTRKPNNKHRWPRRLILGGLLALLLAAGLKGWRIYQHADALLGYQAQVEGIAANGLDDLTGADTLALATGIRTETVGLIDEIEPFLPFAEYFTWLPRVGPLMPAAPELIELADSATAFGYIMADGLHPAVDVYKANGGDINATLPGALAVINGADSHIKLGQQEFNRLLRAYENLKAKPDAFEALPWTIRSQLPKFEPLIPFAQDGLQILPALPELAGYPNAQTYLLIAQNDDEIRPTGGLISGVGILVADGGQIVSLDFVDSYAIDNWQEKPYDFPPQPLYEFMAAELFLFRDANFWPDFPRSAEQMMALYAYGQGQEVDGIIAIDQKFVQALVSAIEPVEVPEMELTLTGQNTVPALRDAWTTGAEGRVWFASRKAFLGPMTGAIRQKLEQNISEVDLVKLITTIDEQLRGKHLQIYSRSPEVAAALNQAGWDGDILATDHGDHLLIVDTNVGFNKANAAATASVSYDVQLNTDRSSNSALSITYAHPNQPADEITACEQRLANYSDGGLIYQQLIDQCYWNYLRIFVPSSANLQTSTQLSQPPGTLVNGNGWDGITRQQLDEQLNMTVFDNLIAVQPTVPTNFAVQYVVEDAWETRISPAVNRYTLTVHKQPGLEPRPITISISLPDGSSVVSSSVNLQYSNNEQTLTYTGIIDQTFSLEVEFN